MNTQYLSRDGGVIAYDDQGQGPLVVCAPAAGDLRSEYRFLTPKLVAAGYRVVCMDLRGQGESSSGWSDYGPSAVGSDMLALIEHLNETQAVLIGTSVATAAAIWASVKAPDRVGRLVLISGNARAASAFQAGLMANLFISPLWGRSVYISYFPKMYPSARPDDFDTHRSQVDAMLKEPGRLRAMRSLFATAYRDWDACVPQVTVPTLVMMGSRDPDFPDPEQVGRALAERMKMSQVTVRIVDGAGHHVQTEVPDEAARSILDFIQATPQETD